MSEPTFAPLSSQPEPADPMLVAALERSLRDNLFRVLGRFPEVATPNDLYLALAYAVRDRLMVRWVRTGETYYRARARTVVYLSAEFLLGPQLGQNLLCLDLTAAARQAVAAMGLDLDDLLDREEEPGLGNGGLGRLAACYLDSLATLQVPAIGYGIRYEFGIFDQAIRDGWQVEMTDKWLRLGNPWEIARPEIAFDVQLGGRTEAWSDDAGRYRVRWVPERVVRGVAYDTPVLGYRVGNVNLLRLWKAEAVESFDFQAFNLGDYCGAVEEKVRIGDHQQGALPQRRLGGGQAPAARAAVLLRQLRAAGHDPPPPAVLARRARPRRQIRGAAQRHPSGGGRRRADAPARRRARAALG